MVAHKMSESDTWLQSLLETLNDADQQYVMATLVYYKDNKLIIRANNINIEYTYEGGNFKRDDTEITHTWKNDSDRGILLLKLYDDKTYVVKVVNSIPAPTPSESKNFQLRL